MTSGIFDQFCDEMPKVVPQLTVYELKSASNRHLGAQRERAALGLIDADDLG
jgi:hypothetical protein